MLELNANAFIIFGKKSTAFVASNQTKKRSTVRQSTARQRAFNKQSTGGQKKDIYYANLVYTIPFVNIDVTMNHAMIFLVPRFQFVPPFQEFSLMKLPFCKSITGSSFCAKIS